MRHYRTKPEPRIEAVCDCRVWRKALVPLMSTARKIVGQARASERIGGVAMKRIPDVLVAELREGLVQALMMFPPEQFDGETP